MAKVTVFARFFGAENVSVRPAPRCFVSATAPNWAREPDEENASTRAHINRNKILLLQL